MTPAERQRRHRLGFGAVTKPPAVTKQPAVTISPPDVTRVPETLLSREDVAQWARDLGIEDGEMDRLVRLIWESELDLWKVDPEETARAYLRRLGYSACLDVYEALGKVMDEDDEVA